MRYALTYTLGGFERTDTIIVQVNNTSTEPYLFGDQPQDIYLALQQGTALEDADINEIINNKSYYLHNVDDIDTTLSV